MAAKERARVAIDLIMIAGENKICDMRSMRCDVVSIRECDVVPARLMVQTKVPVLLVLKKSESKQNYKASQTPSWLKVQW